MNVRHPEALTAEVSRARARLREGAYAQALLHLERAHVLGQRYVLPHLLTHWLMLRAELGRREPVAALGQAVRMVLGVLGNALGRLPIGNTGGSNVSMFRPMPIPPELASLMLSREERRTP
jgi:hypothetical protein